MRAKQFIFEDQRTDVVQMFKDFLPVAMEVLELDNLPKMKFVSILQQDIQPSFGEYDPDNNSLTIALVNRHPNDILRTVAHELVHHKQNVTGQLKPDSGRTGSPEENQAHVLAGIIMRFFNKKYPQYLRSSPLTEKWTTKYKRSINCARPKGFSQRAHCQGRKK